MATCPECDAEIEVDEFDVDKGDQLSCPECGSNLEVVSLAPLELDVAPDDDEDEDDDDDDAEDEEGDDEDEEEEEDRKSTRLNSSHSQISYAVFCLKKKKT